MSMTIISHNVQSLKGKVQYYRAQIHTLKPAVVGLQETALEQSQMTAADGYLRLSSAAKNGHGGTELWLATSWPAAWIGQRPLFWDAAGTMVLVYDSEMLIAVSLLPGLGEFLLVVGHAPHQGRPPADRDQWWRTLRRHITRYRQGRRLILMLDANAQLGSIPAPGIGSFAAAEEDDAGTSLRELATDEDLWAPSTFHHHGDVSTWFSNASKSRTGRRIDYILASSDTKMLTPHHGARCHSIRATRQLTMSR